MQEGDDTEKRSRRGIGRAELIAVAKEVAAETVKEMLPTVQQLINSGIAAQLPVSFSSQTERERRKIELEEQLAAWEENREKTCPVVFKFIDKFKSAALGFAIAILLVILCCNAFSLGDKLAIVTEWSKTASVSK